MRIKDVALKAGVSTATVSHVINETRYVAEKTREKVLDSMKALNYHPNSVARSLRSNKTKIIGLLIPVKEADTSNFFFMSIAHGIESKLNESGYQVILSNSKEDEALEQKQLRMFASQNVDGMIIASAGRNQQMYHDILPPGCPVVFIDRKPEGYEGDCVLVDNYRGTYEAVTHLLEKGHRDVGYITGPLGITTSDDRFEGYQDALKAGGIKTSRKLVKEGVPSLENGKHLTRELLKTPMSALFIANNIMTIGAISCLQENRISIPSKLAVIGYDDYEWTQITQPPLSVIRQPSGEIGRKAAEILLARIDQGGESGNSEYRLQTELLIRGSS
ncbi:LacI family transcriptional regulator [Alteribacter lacisalsi]|uniref:Catabolite control protein A n=1 Tax=Alteribacter lacisalsi TaxID=2045244 RepID=A0A2W0HQH7_9BACI|nr:LacI family transcriptional regulator [Alteribacter lacisalsi]